MSSIGNVSAASNVKTVDREAVAKKDPIREAAEGFEQVLVKHMIDEMRKTVHEDSLIKQSNGEKIYRSWLDQEYAGLIAKNNGGLGLANIIESQMKEMMTNQSSNPRRGDK